MNRNFSRASLAFGVLAAMLSPLSQGASVSVADATWTPTGAAGIIFGDSTVPNSPIGNARFGYITTFEGISDVSPLELKTDGKGNETDNNGSIVVSSAFSASANDTLSLHFNYVSTDGRGYDDYAWARLVNAATNDTAAWLFTARSTNSARGNVVPGDVLKRQVDSNAPDELDAVLNDGNSIGFNVSSTEWIPLGTFSGYCWDTANTCGPTGWIESAYTFTSSGQYRLEFGVVNWGDEVYDSALAFDFGGLQAGNFSNVTLVNNDPSSPIPEPTTYALMLAGLAVTGVIARKRKASKAI